MIDLLKQFEEDCEEDEQAMRHEAQTANLAARLQGIDLGIGLCFHRLFYYVI